MGHEVAMAGAVRPPLRGRRLNNALEVAGERFAELDRRRQYHLIRRERQFKPDLIITLDRRIHPWVVKELKSGGARVALWFPDAVSNLGRHDMFLAPYDRFFFKNPRLVDQLSRVHQLPVSYLPEAANSDWHRSSEPYGADEVVVIAGNIHPTRAILIDHLVQAGLPVVVYGSRPPKWVEFQSVTQAHTARFIARREKASIFRRARVVLNNLHPAEYAGMNCRLFEAAASGAAVLTEVRPGLEDLFELNREVIPFGSLDELVVQCHRLLSDPSAGRATGDAAAYRAHREHTYEQRLGEMLSAF
ncbi:glycosyltransferase [Microbacterium sp. LRZ72]|uniref:CgeB family protein n=1 Tax=Microbacterium sp. LRZ72 TaxID=2942481 RepID=UPI0029B45D61|nr:glycosyltransferase [Microbacterium sp. LRZ72]MDX2377636.1 glycosyltransferase [Microbacterium sp. LRZ72]